MGIRVLVAAPTNPFTRDFVATWGRRQSRIEEVTEEGHDA